jgi:signal peptidase II
MKKSWFNYSLIILIMFAAFASDYYSKKWAEDNLKDKSRITLIKDFVDLGFTENRGMIFGLLNNKMPHLSQIVFIGVRILILIALSVFIWYKRKGSLLFIFPFLLIWAGAIGNLIDSFKYGYVVDFIHIQLAGFLNWPFYFNLADAYVTIGVCLILIKEIIHHYTTPKPQKV